MPLARIRCCAANLRRSTSSPGNDSPGRASSGVPGLLRTGFTLFRARHRRRSIDREANNHGVLLRRATVPVYDFTQVRRREGNYSAIASRAISWKPSERFYIYGGGCLSVLSAFSTLVVSFRAHRGTGDAEETARCWLCFNKHNRDIGRWSLL